MKKINLCLTLAIITGVACFAAPSMSEDNIFGNLTTTPPPATTAVQTTTVKVDEPIVVRGSSQMTQQENLTSQSLQSTISSIESAQNDLRSKLEVAQSNYNSVDREYIRVKQERAALKKIVKKTNSRLKTLERTKKSIQKTLQTESL